MSNALWVVVPAAGIGARVGGDKPKQYQTLHGKAILEWTLERLLNIPCIAGVVVVLASDDTWWSTLSVAHHQRIITTTGGDTRAHSVINGIKALPNTVANNDWLLVHDAARPCVTQAEISKLIEAVQHSAVGGLLALPVTDTIKHVNDAAEVEKTLNRNQLWRALTPQMFPRQLLLDALKTHVATAHLITDESSAIEAQGLQPLVVTGSEQNIKVTWPEDLALAAFYLQGETQK